MATKNIVPNANGEGQLGTSSKFWSKSHINTITVGTSVVPDAQDGAALGTTSLQFSDLFLADSSVIGFGDDNDTTLTHTDGSGLTLNSTNKLMFNDASQFIQGSSATVLSLGATDEIDLTATAIDVNGTMDVSGNATFASNARIGSQAFPAFHSNRDVLLLGQRSNLHAIDSSGNVYLNNNIYVDSSGNDKSVVAGGAAQIRLSDNEILMYTSNVASAANETITLTPRLAIESDGVIVSSSGIEFEGTALSTSQSGISSSGNGGEIRIYTNGNQAFTFGADGSGGDLTIENGNLGFASDSKSITFGAGSDVFLTHDHDKGLILKNNVADAAVLTFQTSKTAIASENAIGKMQFQAPNESDGSDAITVGAEIKAVAAEAFGADAGGMNIIFGTKPTGNNAALTDRLTISSVGLALFKSSYVVAGNHGGEVTVGGSSTDFGIAMKFNQSGATSGTIYLSPGYANDAAQLNIGAGSSASSHLAILGDGEFFTGTDSSSPVNATTSGSANVFINSGGSLLTVSSSRKFKNTITDATHGLSDVLKLRSVTYKSNNTKIDGDKTFGGFIAEEVHDVGLTEFVHYDDNDEPKSLHYSNMVSLLTKAIQEQQAVIEDLKSRIEVLEG